MLDQGTIVLAAADVGYGLGALSPIIQYDEYGIKFGDMFTFDHYANQSIVLSDVTVGEYGNITYTKFISPTYSRSA